MSLVYGDTAKTLSNRREFLGGLGIDYRQLVCAQQAHGCTVRQVQESDRGKGALSEKEALAATDALITDQKRLPLAVFTADCLPVFLYDPRTVSIGLIHAGWRSTYAGITALAVRLMQERFQTRPEDLCVGFGPAIRECCYAVGEEFKNFFACGVKIKNGSCYLDLAGIQRKQLDGLGVQRANISDAAVCTCCRNLEFFSYRRQGIACGRMMSVIMLK